MVMVMVFNTTFTNSSAISWQSVLLVEETKFPEKTTNLPEVTWSSTGFPYNMMFMLFNSNMTGATSGAGAANTSGAP